MVVAGCFHSKAGIAGAVGSAQGSDAEPATAAVMIGLTTLKVAAEGPIVGFVVVLVLVAMAAAALKAGVAV